MDNPKLTPRISTADAPSRRDVVLRSPEIFGLIGFIAAVYPLLSPMRPTVVDPAGSPVDVTVDEIGPGQQIVVTYGGYPIFIRRLTPKEMADAQAADDNDDLIDKDARNPNRPDTPATLANRLVSPDSDLIVTVGICTHLGCIPIEGAGNFGGWFCPCHGSHYDTAGRIRSGPAKQNLAIPKLTIVDETTIRLG